MLLILDDIQIGCGRTGPFSSFDDAGIEPDIICLSKSIGRFGLPMALTLMKPETDIWEPGEHNGTFRGNNLGFVAAAEALDYWKTKDFQLDIGIRENQIRQSLEGMTKEYPRLSGKIRGRGLIQGFAFDKPEPAGRLSEIAFEQVLIMETSGPHSEVAKLMPPVTIEMNTMAEGLGIFENA